MKKLTVWAKEKFISFVRWLWNECKDWRTICILGFVALVLSAPIWVGYIIGFVFKLEWAYIAATVVWGFWLLPGAPFIAVCVSITLLIKRIWQKSHKKDEKDDDSKE